MIRNLYNTQGNINWDYLESQIRTVHEDLLTINDVAGQVAVYSESALTEQENLAIKNIIDSHDPSLAPYPPLDSAGALATLLVVLDLVPLADASNAIGEEPEHLIAEATAWSIAQG